MMPMGGNLLKGYGPHDGEEPKVAVSEAVVTLAAFYAHHGALLAGDLACRLARCVLQLLIPMVALKVFQDYLPAHDLTATGWSALIFAVLAAASSGLEWAGTIFGQWLGFRIEADLRACLFDHLLRLPFAYFDRTKTGEVLSRITGDLRQVGMTAHLLPESLLEITLTLVGAFAFMFAVNARLAAITLVPVPFILVFAAAFQKRIHAVWRGNRRDAAAFSAHVENAVQGIREIKSFTCEDRERSAFAAVNDRFRKSFESMSKLYGPVNSGTQLMVESYSLLYIALGAWMVAHGSASVGQIFAFYMYSRYVTMPMMRIVNFLDMFQQGIVGCRRYLELQREPVEADAAGTAEALGPVKGEIRFEGVRFGYETSRNDVLAIDSLVIPAGSVCALVGPSGGGKSTVAALVPRFYDPQAGRILLDGRDSATIAKADLRRAIGIVAQRPFLFAGTVRDNLLLGRASATDGELLTALAAANLGEKILSLPQGLDTEVGERGVRLSGGEAQRLAIARVFLKDPSVLILDEATSALDTFSEVAVQTAIAKLMAGRTTLVIAHRLSTIRHADRICYVKDGAIVESGTHAELMARDGHYRALVTLTAQNGRGSA